LKFKKLQKAGKCLLFYGAVFSKFFTDGAFVTCKCNGLYIYWQWR